MNPREKKVIVVDDDKSVGNSLLRLLESEDYTVDVHRSAVEYLRCDPPLEPACLILDQRMPGMNGLELQKKLSKRGTGEQVIFITGHEDLRVCVEAMKSGAVNFLLKPFKPDVLLGAIKQGFERAEILKERETIASRRNSLRRQAERLLAELTPREFEVFRYIIAGFLNKQIAAELQVAEKTVKIHRGRVTRKLGISSVADMVRLAQDAGVDPSLGGRL